MARYTCIDEDTVLYHQRDGERPLRHLNAGTEVGSTGDAVAGPPGHGKILPVYVPILGPNFNGWVYMSQLRLVGP
jgi:hypothetical protein